tara:strand:- start:131261 stop:131716 length:456 start_codon:yes stop_codon:yes gene_type:complete
MADIHIDDFYRDVATIFLRLYAVFPRKSTLYVEDICGPDQPDEFGLHNPRFQAGFSAIVWLAEHGYLNFQETIRAEALDQVVLSQKTFLLLTSRSGLEPGEDAEVAALAPSVLEQTSTNIAQLRSALREGSSIRIQKCVTYLLAHPPIGSQ